MNPPKLTILTADTDAACDPENGTCTIPQTPIPSPGAAPVTGAVLPGMEEMSLSRLPSVAAEKPGEQLV